MKCRKCKATLKKKTEICPACGAKVTHTARTILLAALAVALVLGGLGAAAWKLGFFPAAEQAAGESFTLLTDSFTDRPIVDQESALAAIGDAADVLGIRDVNQEFSNCKEDTVGGNTYYRFYQQYEGIPVYGRSVVVAADEKGGSLLLSGNYMPVLELNIEATASQEEINSAIQSYFFELFDLTIIDDLIVERISTDAMVIYNQNGLNCLAYQLDVEIPQVGCYKVIANASRPEVIYAYSTILWEYTYEENGRMEVLTANGQEAEQSINVYKNVSNYIMADVNRRIEVYQMLGENWWGYIRNTGAESEISWSADQELLAYTDEVDALANVQTSYDYFSEILSHFSPDGDSASKIYIRTNFCIPDGTTIFTKINYHNYYNNAYSGTNLAKKETYIFITPASGDTRNTCSASLDTVAHEYTHAVVKYACDLNGTEADAINEGCSDIFGELVEAWKTGACDWIHGRRIIYDPSVNGYAERVSDENNGGEDYSHGHSTVISHAAYLMYTGIDGNPNYAPLSTEELAHLFYETLYTLPSDCTFSQFGTLMQRTAEIMWKQGRLEYAQTRSVSNAFFQTGIDTVVTPVAKGNLSLDVYGGNGLLYENYTLYVQYNGAEKICDGTSVRVEGVPLPLAGQYTMRIVDNANPDNETTLIVQALERGGAKRLPVFTECGMVIPDKPILPPEKQEDAAPLAYLEACRKTSATGSWTEVMNMTADASAVNGGADAKFRMTADSVTDIDGWKDGDLSSLRLSGSANVSSAGQQYVWTMTYENGKAHYDYTEPSVTSAEVAMDPGYFNFSAVTEDMVSKSRIAQNKLRLILRGDAMTQAGLAASLLEGVSELQYGDVTLDAEINPDTGALDTLRLTFHASMVYQGMQTEADYSISYQFAVRAASGAEDETEPLEESVWLEDLPVLDSDRYTGNQGDSFIAKIGTRNGTADTCGNDYAHGLEAWIARWNDQDESSWAWCTYELGGKYQVLSGTVGILDGSYNKSDFDTTLEIWGDGELLYSLALSPDMENAAVHLSVDGVKVLKISLYDNKSVSGGTSFALGNFQLHSSAEAQGAIGLSDLLDGYWENNIQGRKVYRFLDDGTVQEYDIEPSAPLCAENLHACCALRYSYDGKQLILEGDGYQTVLEPVTTASPISWDQGLRHQLAGIPDGTVFFYETGWSYNEFYMNNAMYLTKAEAASMEGSGGGTTPVPLPETAYAESYEAILGQYPASVFPDAKYTLYDVDKDEIPELIVRCGGMNYDIYSFNGTESLYCGLFQAYDQGLYEYDGNGLVVHDGGMGSLHLEYAFLYTLSNGALEMSMTLKSTEVSTGKELRAYLDGLTPIDSFYPMDDPSHLRPS